MFRGQTNLLPYVRNYAEAHAHFEKTKQPPRSKKWHASQRPLKDSRSYHYRIERPATGDTAYYDLVLYNTVMARYHKPDAEGNERRQYMGWESNTSWSFLCDVAGMYWSKEFTTTDNRKVLAPVYIRAMPGEKFSLDAWFTPSNHLMVERSQHTRHYRKVSTKDDKVARARARQLFDPLLTIAAMRIPEYAASVTFDSTVAGAFKGVYVQQAGRHILKDLHAALLADQTPAPAQTNMFMLLGQQVFNKMASDRAHARGLLTWRSIKAPPEYSDIEPIDEAAFIKALWNKLQTTIGLVSTNGYSEYPQFPTLDVIVRSNITTYLPSDALIVTP